MRGWGIRNHEGYMDLTAYDAIKNAEKEQKKMSVEKIYKGDIFTTIKLDQTEGCPAVIISSNEINENNACVMVVYLTDKGTSMRDTDVMISARGNRRAECGRIYTIHKSRLSEYIRTATSEEMKEVDQAIMVALEIPYTQVYLTDPEDSASPVIIEQNPEMDELKVKYAETRCYAEEMEKRAAEAEEKANSLKADLTKAEAKMDVYKSLYDETLDKLMGAMV